MRGCLYLTQTVRQLRRRTLSWRTARLFCAVWFALTSIGLPSNLMSLGGPSCARNPGQNCRCSITKRMSGTCCCARDSKPQATKSCCSTKHTGPKLSASVAPSYCPSKSSTQSVVATPPKVELSIANCDCGSDSPASVPLAQEPRLPATVAIISLPETTVAFVTLPTERVESALLLPPVPPPKVVL